MINKINFLIDHHEAILKKLLLQTTIPADRLREAVNYSLFAKAKRVRPLLVYFSGELVQTQSSVLDIIAAAIELIHGYSLIHDDLPAMDNDDFRRGNPTCHKAFDEATAILAGDGLQGLAIQILLTELPKILSPEKTINTVKQLVYASGFSGMVSGQSLDLSELTRADIKEDQLKTIHSLKTGEMIKACISMVLAASEASELAENCLEEYASSLGLAFQMQDDYLDAYAPISTLGKERASDKANQKTTFASLYNALDLQNEINICFGSAKETLLSFASENSDLYRFTNYLQQRTKVGVL
jgi:farnesyl diphosphate synthase